MKKQTSAKIYRKVNCADVCCMFRTASVDEGIGDANVSFLTD